MTNVGFHERRDFIARLPVGLRAIVGFSFSLCALGSKMAKSIPDLMTQCKGPNFDAIIHEVIIT